MDKDTIYFCVWNTKDTWLCSAKGKSSINDKIYSISSGIYQDRLEYRKVERSLRMQNSKKSIANTFHLIEFTGKDADEQDVTKLQSIDQVDCQKYPIKIVSHKEFKELK